MTTLLFLSQKQHKFWTLWSNRIIYINRMKPCRLWLEFADERQYENTYTFTSRWIGHSIFSAPRPINRTPSCICFPMAPASYQNDDSQYEPKQHEWNNSYKISKKLHTLRVFIVINSWESIFPAFIRYAIFPNPTGWQKIWASH